MALARSHRSNLMLGVFLIILGIFILIVQIENFYWRSFWPSILISLGILFVIGFLINRLNFSLLMPAAILLIIGALFQYCTLFDWYRMEYLWPTFILAPGIGFFFMYFFGPKNNKLWIPGIILITIAVIFYAQFWYCFRFWPIVLIIIGVYLILSQWKEKEPKGNN